MTENEFLAAAKAKRPTSSFCQKCNAWHGQLGLEPTFQLYLDHMMIVCAEIKRVLKKTGSFWMNMGDTYGGSGGAGGDYNIGGLREGQPKYKQARIGYQKCLLGIPWRLVLRLIDEQDWILRNCIIWEKPNSMPSSVKDRLSNSYEFLFHLVKNTEPQYYWNKKTGLMADRKPPKDRQKEGIDWDWQEVGVVDKNVFNVRVRDADTDRFMEKATEEEKTNYGKPKLKKRTYWHSLGYWYDLDAIREPHKVETWGLSKNGQYHGKAIKDYQSANVQDPSDIKRRMARSINPAGKNPGDMWSINTQPRPEAHFATFPDKLCIKPILATCPAEICKKCGKARVRITEINRNGNVRTRPEKGKRDWLGKGGNESGIVSLSGSIYKVDRQTIGWTSCSCGASFRPGVLLDPFAGRGTALVMAKKLGRHYVGYELSQEYCEKLIKPALDDIDPLFQPRKH